MSNEAALKAEIARLSGAIDRHKSTSSQVSGPPAGFRRNNTYMNPSYKPPQAPSRPPSQISKYSTAPGSSSSSDVTRPAVAPREVLIDGVAFRSSGRSLVRKDLPQPKARPPPPRVNNHTRMQASMRGTRRVYKPKTSRTATRGRNMTLHNAGKAYPSRRKIRKQIDKQCSRFATTGICPNGLTCLYQHDPAKIGICWPFLQGSCPHTASTCLLSHDPTPERTPLCVHFANNGRCKNGEACPFPHVRVGPREGICRDFAVLGFCEKGLDCDKQHVRECPDFAENGKCPNLKCRLPHVIRANRGREKQTVAVPALVSRTGNSDTAIVHSAGQDADQTKDSRMEEDFISLTFHESEEDDEDEEDDEGDGDEDSDDTSSSEENADDDHELTVEA